MWPVWTVALCPPWFWNRLRERESFSRERKQKQKPSSRKNRCRKWLCVLLPPLISFTLPLLSPSYEQLKCFLLCCDPRSQALFLLTLLLKLRSKSKTVKMYPACQDPVWVPTELVERTCREVGHFWQLATATLLGLLSCWLLRCLSELAVASYRRWTTFLHICTLCYSNGVLTLPAGCGGNPIHWG